MLNTNTLSWKEAILSSRGGGGGEEEKNVSHYYKEMQEKRKTECGKFVKQYNIHASAEELDKQFSFLSLENIEGDAMDIDHCIERMHFLKIWQDNALERTLNSQGISEYDLRENNDNNNDDDESLGWNSDDDDDFYEGKEICLSIDDNDEEIEMPTERETRHKKYKINPNLFITIENYVFTTYLVHKNTNIMYKLPLQLLCSKLLHMGCQHNLQKFAKVVFRYRPPFCASHLTFQSGVVVATGSPSIEVAKATIKFTVQKFRQDANLLDITIGKIICQNIVATGHLKFKLCLFLLAARYGSYVTYDKESFAGAIIRHPDLEETKVTMLAFAAGSIICVGSKSEKVLKKAYKIVYPLFEACRDSEENIKIDKQLEEKRKKERRGRKRTRTDMKGRTITRGGKSYKGRPRGRPKGSKNKPKPKNEQGITTKKTRGRGRGRGRPRGSRSRGRSRG
jgi:TATA-box binding protein (TBP) (component of TFIID and TFIIIB)